MARFEKDDKVFEITSNDGRYTTEQRKHFREGWTRVCDPRCEVPLGAEPHNATFEAALRTDPSDIGTPLVYADWLEQQGHPRGALIAVQHRLATSPKNTELFDAERRIIEEAGDSLISKTLLVHLALFRGKQEIGISRNLHDGGAITFDHGFIRKARLVLKQRGGDEDLLWELLRHPSARVLAELNVTVDKSRDIALVATILTHGPRPPLRSLLFRVEHRGSTVDLQGLDQAYPLLEDLELDIHNVRLGDLALPKLRRLVAPGEHIDLGHLLAARTWPELDTLTIASDHEKYQPAFEQPRFPKLRSLTLQGALHPSSARARPDAGLFMCRMLVKSPDVGHLERIDLMNMSFDDESIAMLEQNRARFERLAQLRVSNISFVGRDRLEAAGYPIRLDAMPKAR